MGSQLAKDASNNVLALVKHKKVKFYGFFKSGRPMVCKTHLECTLNFLLGSLVTFLAPYTQTETVIVSHVVQSVSVTLERLCTCPSANFLPTPFTTVTGSEQNVDSQTRDQAIDYIAPIDAHSPTIA